MWRFLRRALGSLVSRFWTSRGTPYILPLSVQRYTREAGVRSFERKLGSIMRAVALKAAEKLGEKKTSADSVETGRISEFPIIIDEQAVEDILGVSGF